MVGLDRACIGNPEHLPYGAKRKSRPYPRQILAFLERRFCLIPQARFVGKLQRLKTLVSPKHVGLQDKPTDSDHHEFDTIQIFDFTARPVRFVQFIYRHINIASEGALEGVSPKHDE